MEQLFDVIIIGAGPGGCQLARELSKENLSVLLTDRVNDFSENNFSSSGAPLSIIEEFSIPDEVVAARWNKLKLVSSNVTKQWEQKDIVGVVMEFSKLRRFLSDESVKQGGKLLLGYEYKKHTEKTDGNLDIVLNNRKTKQDEHFSAKIIVDASGPGRAVMKQFKDKADQYIAGVGLEHVIETDYYDEQDNLQFFLGFKYTPHGYAWIFPMGNKQYKVGVGWLPTFQKEQLNGKEYLERLISDYMKLTKEQFKVIDKHGGTLLFNYERDDIYQQGRVVGIGDVISTMNPLGGEGIRYAMRSARLASKYIKSAVETNNFDFKAYEKEAKKYMKYRYRIAQELARLVYGRLGDKQIDTGVGIAANFSFKDLMLVLFNNRYDLMLKPGFPYLKNKLTKLFK